MDTRSPLHSFSDRLKQLIREVSQRAFDPVGLDEGHFNELARELFSYQVEANSFLKLWVDRSGWDPSQVDRWEMIPCVPTDAFKEFSVTALSESERTAVFRSSGTTQADRGQHFHSPASLELYEASLLPWFQWHMGDGDHDRNQHSLVVLTPSGAEAPNSSLVHMFETVGKHGNYVECPVHGDIGSDGGWGLDGASLIATCQAAMESGHPVTMVGTAFNFVQLLDALSGAQKTLRLPPGSCLLETGGYKGRTRELTKDDLYGRLERALGIPQDRMVCEYGMCELSSQAYDRRLNDDGTFAQERRFQFPPWVRLRIVSPETGRSVEDGETGMIQIFDLANVWSVLGIQTGDLGRLVEGRLELLGRAEVADAKGCSLLAVN